MTEKMMIETLLNEKDYKRAVAKVSFEEGMKLLEQLVAKVESGTLPLAQAVSSYELASELMERLRGLLGEAEAKLRILEEGPNGKIRVKEE